MQLTVLAAYHFPLWTRPITAQSAYIKHVYLVINDFSLRTL